MEVGIGEGMGALDDGIYLIDERPKRLSEFPLNLFLLSLELLVEPSLFNEVAIDSDGLYLFLESRQLLDLLLHLFFDVDLNWL